MAMKTAKIPVNTKGKARSKGEIYGTLAAASDLNRKQVGHLFDNLAEMMKIKVVRKPATKARRGINPFTKEEMMFKAKPARNVVKVLALKNLKAMV